MTEFVLFFKENSEGNIFKDTNRELMWPHCSPISKIAQMSVDMLTRRHSRLPQMRSLPQKHIFRSPQHHYLDFLTHSSLIRSYIKVTLSNWHFGSISHIHLQNHSRSRDKSSQMNKTALHWLWVPIFNIFNFNFTKRQ